MSSDLVLVFMLVLSRTNALDSLLTNPCNDIETGMIRSIASDDTYQSETKVRCYNNWIILDYSIDSNIQQYFTSFQIDDNYAIPNHDTSWADWFISPSIIQIKDCADCHTCNADDNNDMAQQLNPRLGINGSNCICLKYDTTDTGADYEDIVNTSNSLPISTSMLILIGTVTAICGTWLVLSLFHTIRPCCCGEDEESGTSQCRELTICI
eukprot:114395_1